MRIKALALVMASAFSTVAIAADKLVVAPPPAWVKQIPIPPIDAKPDQASIRLLLQDQQVDLQPGRQTRYSETAGIIQTPQGLSAGNVSLVWNPDTDIATVHKLAIRRGDKVIDVLASGQTFTVVRRESNLENAVLDGVLTATIQPDGLQVGDIVDFAFSISHSDPILKDHIEEIGGGWNGLPITRAHMRVQWPSNIHLQTRETTGLPPLKPSRQGALSVVELSLADLPPIQPPRGAPIRFALDRIWEMSDFSSWSDLARLMAPLYSKAATLPPQGRLRDEISKIAAQSPDPAIRAEAALALVQDRVRYVFLGMNDGGLLPADAETTWSRRFGDCKGKTALLLALLRGLGIDAVPVLVTTVAGDGLAQRLPSIALFNHVLVRATIAGKIYWLDGTRTGDTKLALIKVPYFHWGLPLAPQATLVSMMPPPPDQPMTTTSVSIDATAGITVPAPFHAETVWRDDAAVGMNLGLGNMAPGVRDNSLRDYWRKQYDFVDVKAVSATYDAQHREEHVVMDGDARMDWSTGWYEADGIGVGYKADFTRDPGPDRDAPFAVAYPYSTRNDETILLPAGNHFTIDHPEDIDTTAGGIAYHRHVEFKGARFTAVETERSVTAEFAASDAPGAQETLRALNQKSVHLKKPDNYAVTAKDIAAAMATTPATATGFFDRGNMLLNANHYDAAVADFSKAIALDAKNASALAARGMAYAWEAQDMLADNDLRAAEAIDPRNVAVFQGRGIIAMRNRDYKGAVASFSKAIEIWPGDDFALLQRAHLERELGDDGHALADAAEGIRRSPRALDLYLLRANIFRDQGRIDLAIGEAAAVARADPANGDAQVIAGMIYARCGQQSDAMRAFDKAITLSPSPSLYINRSHARPVNDFAGRQADIEAALKLETGNATPPTDGGDPQALLTRDPDSAMALKAKAELQDDERDDTGAIATLTALLDKRPADADALLLRGIGYARSGDAVAAGKDFASLRPYATGDIGLWKICARKAMAGVDLVAALADCDAALAKAPDIPDYLDSRALVLLRLGRLDDALKAYDQSLQRRPSSGSSLFGRAIVEARKGDTEKSDMDEHAALTLKPGVRKEFQAYGLEIAQTSVPPRPSGEAVTKR